MVIKQGDPGTEFFVIKSGEASVKVTTDGVTKVLATLKPGDYFGESALLRDEPRAATVAAETNLVTFKIGREKFNSLGLNNKLEFANRKAVGGGQARTVKTKPPSPKTDKERATIASALRGNENLATMVTLDDNRVKKLTDVAWKEAVSKGQTLITEGDLVADYFYIVAEGSFEVLVPKEDGGPNSALEVATTISKGGSFGELALLYLVPRAATVRAKEAASVWVIDRNQFKSILMQAEEAKVSEYVKYLGRVAVFTSLLTEEKTAIAKALVEMHFQKGEIVLQQGEPGSTFYVLYDGEVVVTKPALRVIKVKHKE
jgi:CRP-like cAMP-binding protein